MVVVVVVADHDDLAGGGEKGSRPPRKRKDHGGPATGLPPRVTSAGRVPTLSNSRWFRVLSRWCAEVTCSEEECVENLQAGAVGRRQPSCGRMGVVLYCTSTTGWSR